MAPLHIERHIGSALHVWICDGVDTIALVEGA